MRDIVISYRRDDTKWIAGRIFDRLEDYYGHGHVFMDVDSMPVGLDFRRSIELTLARCDILLALIGPKWAGEDDQGRKRIDDENDWVRIEIEVALRKNIPVVPVLIDHCPVPKPHELPDVLRDLAFRHAAHIDTGLDFRTHMERLTRSIDSLLKDRGVADGLRDDVRSTQDIKTSPHIIGKQTANERISQIDQLIECFFVPIQAKLQWDNSTWERILKIRDPIDSITHRVGRGIEQELLKNHAQIESIIERFRHLVDGDEDLSAALNRYLDHIAVYRQIRTSGDIQTFPITLGAPWPKELFPLIEGRLRSLIAERSSLKTT